MCRKQLQPTNSPATPDSLLPRKPSPLVHPGRLLQQNLRRPSIRHSAVPKTSTQHEGIRKQRETHGRLRLQRRLRLLAGNWQVLRFVLCWTLHQAWPNLGVRPGIQVSRLPDKPLWPGRLCHVDWRSLLRTEYISVRLYIIILWSQIKTQFMLRSTQYIVIILTRNMQFTQHSLINTIKTKSTIINKIYYY